MSHFWSRAASGGVDELGGAGILVWFHGGVFKREERSRLLPSSSSSSSRRVLSIGNRGMEPRRVFSIGARVMKPRR